MSIPEQAYNGCIRSVRPVHRTRVIESLFRSSARGREPMAPPGEGGCHVHYQSSRKIGVGCVTSRPAGASSDEEYLAFKHGLTVAQVKELLREARSW